ncbi:MAG: type II toxin-antitoxin system PemK/MazF family toxin [Anaerolineae bacterium]|nr:type II toxin-antitoxin system PemK/MazF family toxin [Anaerolineae bacterium]
MAHASGNVFLSCKVTGLPRDSVANVSQVITIDKGFLTEAVGSIPQGLLKQIEDGLRLVLEL